jgi:hypothetical protein
LNLCGCLTYCMAYGGADIRHCSILLWEVIPFSSVQTALPLMKIYQFLLLSISALRSQESIRQ